jgi:hypothetical protein
MRARGADEPTRFGGARLGLCIKPQEKSSHTALCRAQHEPAAGGKIEDSWRPWNFDDQRAECRAGQRIEARAQNGSRIGRAQKQEFGGIEPQFKQTGRREFAMLRRGEIRSEPKEAFARGRAGSQRRHKAGGYSLVARRSRKNLMQRALENPAM